MKLKDALIMSANLLNLTEERDMLDSISEDNYAEIIANPQIKKLFNLAIMSLRDICFNYLPVIVEQDCESQDKKILTSSLDEFVRLIKVKRDDKPVAYKFKNGEITLKSDGVYTVQYVQNPKVSGLLDELDIFADLSPDILVLGVCAYYSVSMGLYDEFEYFHEEYLKRAESIKKLGVYQMPARRWV